MRAVILLCLLLCLAAPAFGMGCDVIFVKKVSHCDPDSAKCWHRGDPVHVGEIGTNWGSKVMPETDVGNERAEDDSTFVIITVTDVTPEQAANWLELRPIFDEGGGMIRMRRRRMVWATLPPAVRTEIRTYGRYTTSWAVLQPFIADHWPGY